MLEYIVNLRNINISKGGNIFFLGALLGYDDKRYLDVTIPDGSLTIQNLSTGALYSNVYYFSIRYDTKTKEFLQSAFDNLYIRKVASYEEFTVTSSDLFSKSDFKYQLIDRIETHLGIVNQVDSSLTKGIISELEEWNMENLVDISLRNNDYETLIKISNKLQEKTT